MRQLTCTGCGATLEWDGASPVVTCRYCGARFQMQTGQDARGGDWMAVAQRGGCVADRPVLTPGEHYGRVYYTSWLPEGWSYSVFIPDVARYGMSAGSPFVPGIEMRSPDGNAYISHIATNSYQEDVAAKGVEWMAGGFMKLFGMQQQATRPNAGSYNPTHFLRKRTLITAAEYCDEVASLLPGVHVTQAKAAWQPDAFERTRWDKILAQAGPQMRDVLWHEWARRLYDAEANGTPYAVVVETMIVTNGFNVGRAMPASFGSMAPMTIHTWNTAYELALVCPASSLQEMLVEYERVRQSIELGRDYQATKQSISNYMDQVVAQNMRQNQASIQAAEQRMMADNAAHWDRMSAITQDLNQSTTATMHSMMDSTAATNDRVRRGWSETIRGVNTYAGFDGPIEVDIRYDHVYGYQPTAGAPYADAYLGVEGDWLEPGVDFVELPRL